MDEAPPPPKASRLLEMARPWWETWPARFQELSERLGRMQVAYGHAMAATQRSRRGHRVAAIIVGMGGDRDCTAQVLYFELRDDCLKFRFLLDAPAKLAGSSFEVTFVSTDSSLALFSASGTLSVNCEYSVTVAVPGQVAIRWKSLTVTDVMPFSLILRAPDSPA